MQPHDGRAPVVAIEVPAPADRTVLVVDEHAQPHALPPVEVLHHETAASPRPGREVLGRGEELVGGHEPHPPAGQATTRRAAVGLGADDVLESAQPVCERRLTAALEHLDICRVAQLGREVAHGAQDEVRAPAMGSGAREALKRLDEDDAVSALEGRVVAHELVTEDERRVAHQRFAASVTRR